MAGESRVSQEVLVSIAERGGQFSLHRRVQPSCGSPLSSWYCGISAGDKAVRA
jgi:hypothetical protein